MVKPKKQLGQHFLTDPKTARKISQQLKNVNNAPVIEIGPGKGMLTKFLLEKDFQFFVIEKDTESVDYLKENYPQLSGNIIYGDILKKDFNEFSENGVVLISNLPYNISAPVMFILYENRNIINESVLMLQKEVAKRICSEPGSKVYGILSVLIQTYYKTEYLFTVNEGAFFPKPAVKSGVIRLSRDYSKREPDNVKLHKKLVKMSFNKRRKTLRNSLKSILVNLPPDADWLGKRPEQCSIDDFIDISNALNKIN